MDDLKYQYTQNHTDLKKFSNLHPLGTTYTPGQVTSCNLHWFLLHTVCGRIYYEEVIIVSWSNEAN